MAYRYVVLSCIFAFTLAGTMPVMAGNRLNDSGQKLCLVDGANSTSCAGTGQDAEFGRDVERNSPRDGHLGFSFVKIDKDGRALAPDAPTWACVGDKVTGMMWEVKEATGFRSYKYVYTNLGYGVDDVSVFIDEVNQTRLCGHADWRLPTPEELHSLVDYSKEDRPDVPKIDVRSFPNTEMAYYWTSTRYLKPDDVGRYFMWTVGTSTANVRTMRQNEPQPARLVRTGRASPENSLSAESGAVRFVVNGEEVSDKRTGLVWQRCSAGQAWDGVTCVGEAGQFTWQSALDASKREAASTGLAWRLPNQKELASLADYTRMYPAIDIEAFPNTASQLYWTSAHATLLTNESAYIVDFRNGAVDQYRRNRSVGAARWVRDAD